MEPTTQDELDLPLIAGEFNTINMDDEEEKE
jgi:hypothetical protein